MIETYSAETLLRSFTDNLKFDKADISKVMNKLQHLYKI